MAKKKAARGVRSWRQRMKARGVVFTIVVTNIPAKSWLLQALAQVAWVLRILRRADLVTIAEAYPRLGVYFARRRVEYRRAHANPGGNGNAGATKKRLLQSVAEKTFRYRSVLGNDVNLHTLRLVLKKRGAWLTVDISHVPTGGGYSTSAEMDDRRRMILEVARWDAPTAARVFCADFNLGADFVLELLRQEDERWMYAGGDSVMNAFSLGCATLGHRDLAKGYGGLVSDHPKAPRVQIGVQKEKHRG